jgi:hypothetical protein
MKATNEQIKRILAKFSELNGAKYVGIRNYSNRAGEVADYVINSNFSYGNAVTNTIEILESLNESDFSAIAKQFPKVDNHTGEKYGSNAPARLFLETKKCPKEGTKAHTKCMDGVKETQTLEMVCADMIAQYKANQDKETKSKGSIAQSETYESVTKGVRMEIKTEKLEIMGLIRNKVVTVEGEYPDTTPTRITAQKNAIQSYCKYTLNKQLPVTKFRAFDVVEDQLEAVVITGDTITLA